MVCASQAMVIGRIHHVAQTLSPNECLAGLSICANLRNLWTKPPCGVADFQGSIGPQITQIFADCLENKLEVQRLGGSAVGGDGMH